MKVFVYGLLAVGMRHYGSSELIVGEGYYLERDRNNPHDENAVAVVERFSGRKRASLKRDAAAIVAALFDCHAIHISNGKVALKPKSPATFHSRRIGNAQRCNIAFMCRNENREAVTELLSEYPCRFRIA